MAHAPDLEPHKRKRELDDTGSQPAHHHQPAAPQLATANTSLINYLPRPSAHRLPLIQADLNTFGDIIGLVSEYEGVLDRNESLAASFGAKLTGPRFLKGLDNFFEGPIKINSQQPFASPVTWMDVIAFAKASPNTFTLTTMPNGSKCCRFMCKGLEVEISEDDWRLISSSALDRFKFERPFEEDETAELATVEILEQRTMALIKKADELAGRARLLHRKLGYRKHALAQRCGDEDENAGSRFHAVNDPPRTPGSGRPLFELKAELLQQFAAAAPPTANPLSWPMPGTGVSIATLNPLSPHAEMPPYNRFSMPPSFPTATYPIDMNSPANGPILSESQTDVYRSLVTQKTDKLSKGDVINPPCDRCRRLRLQCIKHLTACQGCTKKHARCCWRCVTHAEVAILQHEMGYTSDTRPQTGEGQLRMEELPGPGGSSLVRIPPAGSPYMTTYENAPRPASRADTDPGIPGPFSPTARPISRNDTTGQGRQRKSLPTTRFAAGQAPMPPRDQRMAQISSLLSPTNYNYPPPFANPPNPPPPQ